MTTQTNAELPPGVPAGSRPVVEAKDLVAGYLPGGGADDVEHIPESGVLALPAALSRPLHRGLVGGAGQQHCQSVSGFECGGGVEVQQDAVCDGFLCGVDGDDLCALERVVVLLGHGVLPDR